MGNKIIILQFAKLDKEGPLCILNMKEVFNEEESGAKRVVADNFDFKKVAKALFKDIIGFQRIHFEGEGDNDEGIVYRPDNKTNTEIPTNILTTGVIEKIRDFLAKAKTNKEALKAAEAINRLLRKKYIQKNFATLFDANKIFAMSKRDKKIDEVLANAGDDSEVVARFIKGLDFTSRNIGNKLDAINKLLKGHTNTQKNFNTLISEASDEKIFAMSKRDKKIDEVLEKAKDKATVARFINGLDFTFKNIGDVLDFIDKVLDGKYSNIQKNFNTLIGQPDAKKIFAMSKRDKKIDKVLANAGDDSEVVAQIINGLDFEAECIDSILTMLENKMIINKISEAIPKIVSKSGYNEEVAAATIADAIMENASNSSNLTGLFDKLLENDEINHAKSSLVNHAKEIAAAESASHETAVKEVETEVSEEEFDFSKGELEAADNNKDHPEEFMKVETIKDQVTKVSKINYDQKIGENMFEDGEIQIPKWHEGEQTKVAAGQSNECYEEYVFIQSINEIERSCMIR